MPRKWVWIAQVVLIALVGYFVSMTVREQWSELTGLGAQLRVKPLWLLTAALVVWATYLCLVGAWTIIMRGWSQPVPFATALRIWCLSNLGRYLPGKVWAVAGMAVMAARNGVAVWAATASSLVMQALAVGTGLAVALAAPAGGRGDPVVLVGAGLVVVVAVISVTSPWVMDAVSRLSGRRVQLRALPVGAVLKGTTAALISWFAYGVAFWLTAKGLVGDATLPLAQATGVFALGYIVGLLAVVVPGGLGVREGVLFTLLSSSIGAQGAAILAVGSRLLLTITEITAALAAGLTRVRTDLGET